VTSLENLSLEVRVAGGLPRVGSYIFNGLLRHGHGAPRCCSQPVHRRSLRRIGGHMFMDAPGPGHILVAPPFLISRVAIHAPESPLWYDNSLPDESTQIQSYARSIQVRTSPRTFATASLMLVQFPYKCGTKAFRAAQWVQEIRLLFSKDTPGTAETHATFGSGQFIDIRWTCG